MSYVWWHHQQEHLQGSPEIHKAHQTIWLGHSSPPPPSCYLSFSTNSHYVLHTLTLSYHFTPNLSKNLVWSNFECYDTPYRTCFLHVYICILFICNFFLFSCFPYTYALPSNHAFYIFIYLFTYLSIYYFFYKYYYFLPFFSFPLIKLLLKKLCFCHTYST